MRRALLLPLALAGCATVQPPVRPAVGLPPAFLLAPAPAGEALDVLALLPTADPAFERLNAIAQADSPTLEAALARIDAARAGLRGARADRLPNITASGSVTGQRIGAQQTGSLPPGVSLDRESILLQIGIQASYDPDLFGALRASTRAAVARLNAADFAARAVRIALASDLANAVVNWRTLSARTALARGDLNQAETLTAITAERVRVGVSSDTDRVRAAGLAADARARLADIESQRAAVLGRVVTLTARPAQQVRAILESDAPDPTLARLDGSIPTDVLRNRPDIAAAEARLRAADAEIASAAAQRFPRLTLSAVVGVAALAFGDLFAGDALTGSLGPTLAGPLLDFGRVGARIDAAQASSREAFADYRRLTFTALGETETAYGQALAADERVAQLARQVALNEDAARLTEIRYRSGLENFVGVVDARRQAFASRQSLAQARDDARTARIALFRALGGAEDATLRRAAPPPPAQSPDDAGEAGTAAAPGTRRSQR